MSQFLFDVYNPENLELSTWDKVARVVFQEVREGWGTPRGRVGCDMIYQPSGLIAKMQPILYNTYFKIGVDSIWKELPNLNRWTDT